MAAHGCSPIRFFSTTETSFYFEAAEDSSNLVDDAFGKSSIPNKQCFIRSIDNKFVILDGDGQLKATNLSEAQLQADRKFNIQFYNDSRGGKSRAVMLYIKKDGKTMVACCNEKNEICPVEMDVPQHISQSQHRAVFYRRELSSSKYSLESSMYPSKFMAFEPDQSSTLYKLVLRHRPRDEVDESSQVMLI